MVFSIFLLLALTAGFRRIQPPAQQARLWIRLYQIVAATNGLSWGALGLTFFPTPFSAEYPLFLLLMAVLLVGAMWLLAPVFSVFVAFTVPLMLGAVLSLALYPGNAHYELAILLAATYALGTGTAWRLSRAVNDLCHATSEKQRVVADLSARQVETEQSNMALLDELAAQGRHQAELEANEQHFRALVETSGNMVWAIDETGCYTYVNGPAAEAIIGYQAEDVIGCPFTQFAEAGSAQAFDEEFFRLKESGGQLHLEGEYSHRNGHAVYLSINAIALHDGAGNFCGASGTAIDVTEVRTAEALLRKTLAKQEAILNAAMIGIAFVQDGEIVSTNAELERMFGYPPGGVTGKAIDALYSIDVAQALLPVVNSVVAGGSTHDSDQICRRRDGGSFWCRISVRAVEEGNTQEGTIWVIQDISDRKQKEQVIEYTALHDALTGLPNRVLLRDRLEQAVSHAARANTKFGVLFIDLDRFKLVNDTIGHDGGDQLLRTVAERLRRCVRSEDTVARQGGDEFIVVLPETVDSASVEAVAERILAELAKPIAIFGNDYVVTGSIGISIYPDHGNDVPSLLKHADAAMYLAKEVGKDTYRLFSEELDLHANEEIRLENLLRIAIEREQLEVFYQPRIDLATGRVNSLEALARWQHAELGWIGPNKFIPVAERAGLIGRLGDWVLRRACRDITYLSALGYGDIGISVNVSRRQFTQPGLVANVCKVLKEYDLDPRRLELELTESTIAHDTERAVQLLKAFEAVGIGISIDDFGTGYSSLSQLKRFPVRTLKIDRSFVSGLPGEREDVAITLAVITMAKRLDMLVVAEGVETPEQRQFLAEHDCDEGQGYFFSKPLPLSEIVHVLKARARPESANTEAGTHNRFRRFMSSLSAQ